MGNVRLALTLILTLAPVPLDLAAYGGHAPSPQQTAAPHVSAAPLPSVSGQLFNVKSYGATGNGTSDDSAALHRTLDFRQQPASLAAARVDEQLLRTKVGEPVGPQVTRVDEPLVIGLDQQSACVGGRVADGSARDLDRASGTWANVPFLAAAERRMSTE